MSFRVRFLHLLLLIVFGFWIPWFKGIDFLDTMVLAAYACIGAIFAGPAAVKATELGRNRPGGVTKPLLLSVLYGEGMALVLLAAGIGTVYLSHRGGYVPSPDLESLWKLILLGLAACIAIALLAALLTLQFSARVATLVLRCIFFGLLVAFFYSGRWLPEVGLQGAIALGALAGLFALLLKKKLA